MFPLVEGQTLLGRRGRYRFLCRVDSGTFAVILKAVDTATEATVAIKCILEPALNAIGEREARVLHELNERDPLAHVAVVRSLDRFVERGHFCVVLELLAVPIVAVGHWGAWPRVQPPVLDDREPRHKLLALVGRKLPTPDAADALESTRDATIERVPPLNLDRIRQIAVHLCAALAFVHDHGLIHADLKPENIVTVINSNPQVEHTHGPMTTPIKLVDFGNCIERHQVTLYEVADAADETGGFEIQTLAYRAPEVATGLVIAPAMDMWSLGCLLVECATGEPLFTSASNASSSLTTASELVEQIEWLVAGGKPLSKVCTRYSRSRYYQQRRKWLSVNKMTSASAATSSFLPLRHRLATCRSATAANTDVHAWLLFQDFVEQLLDIDPDARLSARTAYLHPFLQAWFPFQVVFAPSLSATSKPIDTSEDVFPEQPQPEKKRKLKTLSSEQAIKKQQRRSGLKQALKLIPPMTPPIKPEPKH